VLRELFNPVGLMVSITTNEEQYHIYQGVKFQYGGSSLGPNIISTPLLFQTSIATQKITMNKTFNGDWDVLAAAFYILSQYDEYLDLARDDYGRLYASSMLHVRKGLHEIPIVDVWRIELLKWLNLHYPDFTYTPTQFSDVLTVDIDSAYAYLHKGFYRTLGGFGKDLSNFKFGNAVNRLLTLMRIKKDVFETYNELAELSKKHNLSLIYFFLLADFKGQDVNISHQSNGLRRLVEKLSLNYALGIHPGLYSHENEKKLHIEIGRLDKITRRKTRLSRQHFLKFHFPNDAYKLNDSGIEKDYSIGFFDAVGYKNGTTLPVHFFDLISNQALELNMQSFCAMDATLVRYLKLQPIQAIEKLRELRKFNLDHNLPFTVLWHNESLSNSHGWQGWKNILDSVFTSPIS
jgi:hypothetical protein